MKSTGQVCVHDSEDDEDEEPQNTSEKGGRLDGVGARERHVRVRGPVAARPRARCRAGGRELVGVRRRCGSPRCPARSRLGRPARGAAAGGGATLGGLADRRRARAARRRPCVVRAAAGRDRGRLGKFGGDFRVLGVYTRVGWRGNGNWAGLARF